MLYNRNKQKTKEEGEEETNYLLVSKKKEGVVAVMCQRIFHDFYLHNPKKINYKSSSFSSLQWWLVNDEDKDSHRKTGAPSLIGAAPRMGTDVWLKYSIIRETLGNGREHSPRI